MINVKKIIKAVGVVALVFFLAILGYVFTPFLALLIVSMQSITAVLFELVIVLVFLTLIKILIQVLGGNRITFPIFQTISRKLKKIKKQKAEGI